MNEVLTIQFDGGSRGNPGPAGIGVVVRAADDTPLLTLGRFIGKATNNVAEYRALITGLEEALKLGAKKIYIRGDSELIIKQLKGIYRVKHPDMKTLYEEAMTLLREFDEYKIDHNLRHKNELADKLANLAMDRRADVFDANANESPLDIPAPREMAKGDSLECAKCGCEVEVTIPTRLRPHQMRDFVCVCGTKMMLKE